jgi:hypothetical protein
LIADYSSSWILLLIDSVKFYIPKFLGFNQTFQTIHILKLLFTRYYHKT